MFGENIIFTLNSAFFMCIASGKVYGRYLVEWIILRDKRRVVIMRTSIQGRNFLCSDCVNFKTCNLIFTSKLHEIAELVTQLGRILRRHI